MVKLKSAYDSYIVTKEAIMVNKTFKKLFEPLQIGNMQLKNRIALPPMGTAYAEEGGYVGQRTIDYYEARASGGAGLIIVEGTAPGVRCRGPHQLALGDDRYIPGWQELTKAIHKHGAKVAVQLHHAGMELRDGKYIQVSPSPVIVLSRMVGISGTPPHELTIDEIKEIVQWFADATKRAIEAGVDGAEIHGAHQYIVASFLSSATNKRQDTYGGSVENKARLLIEIIQAMRKAAGPDYPIWPRLNAEEYGFENGITLEETKQVVPMAVKAGANAIHVSAYAAGSYVTKAPLPDTTGLLVPLAEAVKNVTSVPVITVGRLDHEFGERVLEEGKADIIAIGRRLLADPELPNKAAEGRLNDIRPCIGCMECIERLGSQGQGVICTINAAAGKEREYRIQPATKAKRVVIVGAGPAGMEAARVAALRGHRVTLFEKEAKLGGQLNLAALPPNKQDIIPWINYLVNQLKKARVETRLNTEATQKLIIESKPDAVLLALGGIPILPTIPGVNRQNVVTALDVLSGRVNVGKNVVIIGGGLVGCETGYYLSKKGKKVVIIEVLKRMATEMGLMVRRRLMDGLRAEQVIMLTSAKCEEILECSVTVTTGEGKKETFPADTVILAVGYKANDDLLKALQGKVPAVYCIGDASQPQGIMEAIQDGYRTALSL
jgi:2,4-dienoyl-CoA reductase-like NADH-dependent reductase (Old Yellow Enzyme family)/thioredoxin reductase